MIKRINASEEDRRKLASLPVDPSIDEEDSFDYSRVLIKKPWGHEYLAFKNNDVALWLLNIQKGFRTSLHCHPKKKTSLVVLSGEAKFSTLSDSVKIKTGDGFLIDRGVFHMTEALSSPGIFIMETETPTNKKNLVRLDDKYGRENKRYESGELYVRPRDDSAFDSFHGQDKCYDCEKKFGESFLTVVKYKNNDHFQKEFPAIKAKSMAILKGGILDKTQHILFSYGDVVNTDDCQKIPGISIADEVDLLLIKHHLS